MKLFLTLALTLTAVACAQTSTPLPVPPPVQSPMKTPPPQDTAQAGRKALVDDLNRIAATYTAERRRTIEKIATREAATQRQAQVRVKILGLLGSLPNRIPLNPRTTGSTQMDGFKVDKILFDSQPNFPVTALLYTPDGLTGKSPAIVMAPGHSPAGKAGDVAFASAFAKAGFIVLSYDPIGQGERLQYLDPKSPLDKPTSLATRPTGEHGEAGLQPTLLGDALARYFLWDGMRAVDYLESLPTVDAKRIGAFGCSGGGTMTALLTALDPRIATGGVACYTTSFDALLPSATGVQDSEQSTAGFISAGLDFPDWIELAAPRPYAIIATTDDMFPLAGVKTTEAEARRFYKLFGADKDLALITGPGGHGNLRPILPEILTFYTKHLRPEAAFSKSIPPITDPFDAKANPPRKPGDRSAFPPPPPASLTQVTSTGQLSSSYPGVATVFSLNLARSKTIATPHPKTMAELQRAVRKVLGEKIALPFFPMANVPFPHGVCDTGSFVAPGKLDLGGSTFDFWTAQNVRHRGAAKIVLTDTLEQAQIEAQKGSCLQERIFAFTPRPSPQGTEETKSPILGPFYLTGLRAQLVGRTLIGMRVDDVLGVVDYLASQPDVDPKNITVEGSGHMGLVLLHAAVFDSRIQHVTVHGILPSYRSLVGTPLPLDAPQDILPGVLRQYDIPDLIRLLGKRVTVQKQALPVNGANH